MLRSRRLLALLLVVAAATVVLAAEKVEVAAAVNPQHFQQVELARGVAEVGEPISMAVLPDNSVLHTSRRGELRRTDDAGRTSIVGAISVYSHDEEGLQGVGIDPNFTSNRFIYLFYAPPQSTPGTDAPSTRTGTDWSDWQGVNRLSRFKLNTNWTLDMASEKKVLDVPADRGICCHVGGDIDFDAAGNLYLTTGDDTYYGGASNNYAPLDERPGSNPGLDAQRSAANTNDLRGKLLRIKVNADGSYSIPAGNLYPVGEAGSEKTRPEIYAMGLRNPFRMSVDKATGVVYLGDYGPDASGPQANRGPSGQVEFNRITPTSTGNYGWPYCTGTNTASETYTEWDYTSPANQQPAKFDCVNGPTNNSFRNTGRTTLKPAKPAWIRYGGDAGSPPEFGSGQESPMGGAVYRYNAANPASTKFPASLDGHFFAMEYGRRWIKDITVNADGTRGKIEDFPWKGTQIIDSAFGPNGSLYVLDYGTGNFNGDGNSALYRIDYVSDGNHVPTARPSASPTAGVAPLAVNFSSVGSSDPEGGALTYSWNFGDGATSTAANPSHTYTANDVYTATLTVRDPGGKTHSSGVDVTVGNRPPTVTIQFPANGALFDWGDTVSYQITVTDPDEGPVDCSRVKMTYLLGHETHSHAQTSRDGCSGSIKAVTVEPEDANTYGVWVAEYTDSGANGQPPLTTYAQAITQPRHRQAEHFISSSGVRTYSKTAAEGAKTVGDISNGDWIAFAPAPEPVKDGEPNAPYALSGATSFTARVSSAGVGGKLEVRAGSPTGPVLGSATVTPTGSWETFTTVSGALSWVPSNTSTVYLTFAGPAGALFDLDSFTFAGPPPAEAENWTSQSGTSKIAKPGASGGQRVGNVHNGDWTAYAGVNTNGAYRFSARVSSGGAGGTIQIRSGSPTGTLLGTVAVPFTEDWENYTTVGTNLTANASGPLYLVYVGGGSGALFDVDTFTLTATGTGTIAGVGNKCVDVAGSSTADETAIRLLGCNGTNAQVWTRTGLTMRALGKCLDVRFAGTTDGTTVQLYTCNNTVAQEWVPGPNGSLVNPHSGKCLQTAPDGKTQIGTCNQAEPSQWWRLP